MREIGLHLRLKSTLLGVYEHAIGLNVDSFQCFFVLEENGSYYDLSNKEAQECVHLGHHFKHRYAHGSYWINPAAEQGSKLPAFKKEIGMAHAGGFTHMILHPGSARGPVDKKEIIDRLAENMEYAWSRNYSVQILLENAAHGGHALGGDLNDFKLLRDAVKHPEKLSFCIDTAHAFSYGYSYATAQELERFIDHMDETVGLGSIALIHLNNTYDAQGSKLDRHAPLLEGRIAEDALKNFVMHERLKHIPLLLEVPAMSDADYKATVERVRGWQK